MRCSKPDHARKVADWSPLASRCALALVFVGLLSAAQAQAAGAPAGSSGASSAAAVSERGGGPVGVGFILGDTNGVNMKTWFDDANALQVRLGSTSSQLNSLALTVTFERHFRPVEIADHSYSLPFYFGGGARYKVLPVIDSSHIYMDGGLVGVVGMSVLVPNMPVELFVEVRPTFALFSSNIAGSGTVQPGFAIEGGMGVNYYF